MKINRAIFPSAFTIMNMFCGFLSVLHAIDGRFVAASWYIILAGVFDMLDGKVARFTKGFSKFGVEFDSLADLIAFGLAPSVLVYMAFFIQLENERMFESLPVTWNLFGKLVSFMPLLFSGIRLARFNVKLVGFDKDIFTGLPTPASAFFIATFVIFNYKIWQELHWGFLFWPIILLISFLMVSNIKYDTMPKFTLSSGKSNVVKLIVFFILFIILLVGGPSLMFFPLVTIFVLFGIIRSIVMLIFKSHEDEMIQHGGVKIPE
jgi:CDP-diacylglycerol--serine O-phosphatidyltransferase